MLGTLRQRHCRARLCSAVFRRQPALPSPAVAYTVRRTKSRFSLFVYFLQGVEAKPVGDVSEDEEEKPDEIIEARSAAPCILRSCALVQGDEHDTIKNVMFLVRNRCRRRK